MRTLDRGYRLGRLTVDNDANEITGRITPVNSIFIEPGTYDFLNVGDSSMLEVCIGRLRKFWPTASICVATNEPEKLLALNSTVQPVDASGKHLWLAPWSSLGGCQRFLPKRGSGVIARLEGNIRRRWPRASARWVSRRMHRCGLNETAIREFFGRLASADVVVFSGSGGFNDVFVSWDGNNAYLETLELAVRLGKPVWLFGQGLGPVNDNRLKKRMAKALPRVRLLCLREGNASLHLARELGVPDDRIMITGDDSITLALGKRPTEIGTALGINIRIAGYSGIGDNVTDEIGNACLAFVKTTNAELVPVPIAYGEGNDDVAAIKRTFGLCGRAYSAPAYSLDILKTQTAIHAAGRCRTVLTGSYHGAVFALSQGVPVVGLAATQYYRDKFEGLKTQFGDGVWIVDVSSADCSNAIEKALYHSWQAALAIRPGLIGAAEHQVTLSEAAYRRFRGAIEKD